jgi:hypothetical protein
MTQAPLQKAWDEQRARAAVLSSIVATDHGAFATTQDCTESFDLVYDFVDALFDFPPFGLCARTLPNGSVFLAPFEPAAKKEGLT